MQGEGCLGGIAGGLDDVGAGFGIRGSSGPDRVVEKDSGARIAAGLRKKGYGHR